MTNDYGLIQVVYGGEQLTVTPDLVDVGDLTPDNLVIERVEAHFDITLTGYTVERQGLKIQLHPNTPYA